MYKVLIVDDEHMIKRSLNKLISESGYGFTVVGEAGDGQEALELALEKTPDLILTDISMPVMDGLELIRECRTRQLPCEIVILSGYGEFEYARQALRSNVADYLLKPVRPELLEQVLKGVRDKLIARKQAAGRKNNWLWYCKTAGQRMVMLIRDLDDRQIELELGEMHRQCSEQAAELAEFIHYCSELLLFIEKELESYISVPSSRSDREPFLTAGNRDEAWHALQESIMGHVRNVRATRNHGAHQTIKQAIAYVESHYMDEELSLQTIAGTMDMSLSYASQSFKDAAGVSFTQFLTGLRMEKAKELLRNSDCKIYEAAESVGYPDYPHFTRAFKKYFGYSPKDYRKRMGFD